MNDQKSNPAEISAPTTPGQAEGTARPEQQSQTSPAPTQPEPAEGPEEKQNS